MVSPSPNGHCPTPATSDNVLVGAEEGPTGCMETRKRLGLSVPETSVGRDSEARGPMGGDSRLCWQSSEVKGKSKGPRGVPAISVKESERYLSYDGFMEGAWTIESGDGSIPIYYGWRII
jgi:hypothetical protein